MARQGRFCAAWLGMIACCGWLVLTGCGALREAGQSMSQARDAGRATRSAPAPTLRPLPTPRPTPAPSPMPPALLAWLPTMPSLSTARQILEAANLPITSSDERVTFFVPTDAAFAALPQGALRALRNNPAALHKLLLTHIAPGARTAADLRGLATLSMVNGESLPVQWHDGQLRLKNARIVAANFVLRNGVAHVLDAVVLPSTSIKTPVIDASGAATFRGTYLTVVGSAEPGMPLALLANNQRFGVTLVDQQGHWVIPNTIAPGQYTLLAYTLDATGIPLVVSTPVSLTVQP